MMRKAVGRCVWIGRVGDWVYEEHYFPKLACRVKEELWGGMEVWGDRLVRCSELAVGLGVSYRPIWRVGRVRVSCRPRIDFMGNGKRSLGNTSGRWDGAVPSVIPWCRTVRKMEARSSQHIGVVDVLGRRRL